MKATAAAMRPRPAEVIVAVTAAHRVTKAVRVPVAETAAGATLRRAAEDTLRQATRALPAIAVEVEAALPVTAVPAAAEVAEEDRIAALRAADHLVVEVAEAVVDGLRVGAVGREATARPG